MVSISHLPYILYMDHIDILLFKYPPYPNELEYFEDKHFKLHQDDEIQTLKLKAKSFGFWEFSVQMINVNNLENRDSFDEMIEPQNQRVLNEYCITEREISIQKVLELMRVKLSANMDYYLKNLHELQIDLNRKILETELTDIKLQQEIFYKLMCKLFGDDEKASIEDGLKQENNYEKSFILKDFRILSYSGDYICATARRGDFYLLFIYIY